MWCGTFATMALLRFAYLMKDTMEKVGAGFFSEGKNERTKELVVCDQAFTSRQTLLMPPNTLLIMVKMAAWWWRRFIPEELSPWSSILSHQGGEPRDHPGQF